MMIRGCCLTCFFEKHKTFPDVLISDMKYEALDMFSFDDNLCLNTCFIYVIPCALNIEMGNSTGFRLLVNLQFSICLYFS